MHVKACKLDIFRATHAEESRRLRAKSALVEGGVLAEHMFSTLFSACVSRYLFSFSAHCVIDSRAHYTAIVAGRAGSRDESTGESFRVIRMFHVNMLFCVSWVAARALH